MHVNSCLFLLTTLFLGVPSTFARNNTSNLKSVLIPGFQIPTDQEATRPFPAVNAFHEATVYRPTHPTVFYPTSTKKILDLNLTVKNVMHDVDFLSDCKFILIYKCHANGTWRAKSVTREKPVVICDSELATNISLSGLHILSKSVCRITFQIQSEDKANGYIPDPLNYFQTLQFYVSYSGWMEMTDLIYIKAWQWPGRVLTTDVTSNQFNFYIPQSKPPPAFLNMQLVSPYGLSLLKGLPEYVKSQLSIGVLLQFNIEHFNQSMEHLRFMTDNYPRHTESLEMKTMRTDWETGMMQYSPSGLRSAAQTLVKKSKLSGLYKCSGCVLVSGVVLLYNSLMPQDAIGTPKTTVINVKLPEDTYSSSDGSKRDLVCTTLQNYSKLVTVFAGVEKTILCPIICSDVTATYAFYQTGKALLASPGEEFTRYGSVLVHKSGAAIKFDTNATYIDSGSYSCVAENQRATFRVKVVLVPSFNVTNTELTGGYLPPKIFLFEGDDYSLNCTVHFSEIMGVKFLGYFWFRNGNAYTPHKDFWLFIDIKSNETKITGKVIFNQFSSTVALTVHNVPPFSISEYTTANFNHYYQCDARLTNKTVLDSLGLSEYIISSGTDVVVLERPELTDFNFKETPCCKSRCHEACVIEISLRAELLDFLNAVGITVRAQFTTSSDLLEPLLTKFNEKHSSFDTAEARLTWSMKKGFHQLTKNQAALVASLVPVFTYENPAVLWAGRNADNLRITRNRITTRTNLQVAARCLKDKACVYSTSYNQTLLDSLKISALLGHAKNYELNVTTENLDIPPIDSYSVFGPQDFKLLMIKESAWLSPGLPTLLIGALLWMLN